MNWGRSGVLQIQTDNVRIVRFIAVCHSLGNGPWRSAVKEDVGILPFPKQNFDRLDVGGFSVEALPIFELGKGEKVVGCCEEERGGLITWFTILDILGVLVC